MKAKKFSGFTLIECIVALAVLGVSSLLLVQSYTQLMRVTKMNNSDFNSISEQMAEAEGVVAESSSTVKSLPDQTIKIKRYVKGAGGSETLFNTGVCNNYEFNYTMKVYAVKPYKSNDDRVAEGTAESQDLRYIYFHS